MITITTPLVTSNQVEDIFIIADRYAIIATSSGVEAIDLYTQQSLSYGIIPYSPTAVAADIEAAVNKVYIGTSVSGIFAVSLNSIKAVGNDISNEITQVFSTASSPAIPSNVIEDLAAIPNRLLISTAAGITLITNETLVSSRALISGSNACFITEQGEGYWSVVTSGVEASYNIFPSSGTGVIVPDFSYNATTSIPVLPSPNVSDLSVSAGIMNVIAIATDAGCLVVEENQGNEALSILKTFYAGGNIVSTSLGPNSTVSSGSLHIASPSTAIEFNLADNSIVATRTTFSSGQSITSGTVSIIRTSSVL